MKKKEANLDIDFLLIRATTAGLGIKNKEKKDIGRSANVIVAIAYGALDSQNVDDLPLDVIDLATCERMWVKLPIHRKTEAAIIAMERARQTVLTQHNPEKSELAFLQKIRKGNVSVKLKGYL